MASRPQLTVWNLEGESTKEQIQKPAVFDCQIRSDLIQFVHDQMRCNKRQAYGVLNREGPHLVNRRAGHQHSAHSWGTGRAVARIPRVSGSGTHRAGQGAFGNMCRGGTLFSPTKVWRRWHRKINKQQKNYARASAIAATSNASLVLARGHRVEKVEEVPLVVSNDVESLAKTAEAVEFLKALGLEEEIERCHKKQMRAGKGKRRNRRWRHRVGPLIVYKVDDGLVKAFRNIRGVETCQVSRLNLLQLAPGGHVGRLVIWSRSAMEDLSNYFKTPPPAMMTNSDISRIINSDEVQKVVRAPKRNTKLRRKRNGLTNLNERVRLDPNHLIRVRNEILGKRKKGSPGNQVSKMTKEKWVKRKIQKVRWGQVLGVRAVEEEPKDAKLKKEAASS